MTKKQISTNSEIEIQQTGENTLEIKATNDQLKNALGSSDMRFLHSFIEQITNAVPKSEPSPDRSYNFMTSVVMGIKPKNQIEAMLASQMAAVQIATMTFSRRLHSVETIKQQDSALQAFTKLTRCYTAQMEALKKYRSNGQQKVTVEHVTVNEGGKAIVGSVNHGGEGCEKKN